MTQGTAKAKTIRIGKRAYNALSTGKTGFTVIGSTSTVDGLVSLGLAERRANGGAYLTALGHRMVAEGERTSNGGRVLKLTPCTH